jgi:hypothetical protein
MRHIAHAPLFPEIIIRNDGISGYAKPAAILTQLNSIFDQ